VCAIAVTVDHVGYRATGYYETRLPVAYFLFRRDRTIRWLSLIAS